jgi:hypothetical protein
MKKRTIVGCLLLVLGAACVLEIAVHSVTFHAPARQQWRTETQQHGAARLPRRNTIAIRGDWPDTPVLTLLHTSLLPLRDDTQRRSPAPVFVPPRV